MAYKKIKKKFEERILEQVKTMVSASNNYLDPKRREIERNWELFKQESAADKTEVSIHGNVAFNAISLFLALEGEDEITVKFQEKSNKPSAKERAIFLTENAKNDFEVGEYSKQLKLAAFQKYFSGVGVLYFNRWNDRLFLPNLLHIPTINMLFDPKGTQDIQKHRWAGFYMQYFYDDLMQADDFIHDSVSKIMDERSQGAEDDDTVKSLEREQKRQQGYVNDEGTVDRVNEKHLGVIEAIDLFTTIKKDDGNIGKFLITVDRAMTRVIRLVEMKPVNEEEKKNPRKIQYPIVLNHFNPASQLEPIGMNIFDVTADKQVALSTILNLSKELLAKNLSNTLLYNKNVVDGNDLSVEQDKLIGIDVEQGSELSAAVLPLQLQQIRMGDVVNLIGQIEKQLDDSLGISSLTLGSGDADISTATQSQQVQQNANTRHADRIKNTLTSRKEMWKMWYDQYKRFYKNNNSSREKILATSTGYLYENIIIRRSTFANDYPDIEVRSKTLDAEQNSITYRLLTENLQNLSAIGNEYTLKEAMKEILKTSGSFEEEQLNKLIPTDPEYEMAMAEISLLAADEGVELLPIDNIEIRLQCQLNIPTEAGRKRRSDLLQAARAQQYTERMQAQQQQAETEGVDQSGSPRNAFTGESVPANVSA